MIVRTRSSPTRSFWPTHLFSTNPRSCSSGRMTMLGRNLLASKRAEGQRSRSSLIVAVVSRWMVARSKNVPGAMASSVTVS